MPGFAGFDLDPVRWRHVGKMDFITSALTQDRHWLLAYVPVTNNGARTFTVDTDALDGPVRARWFDPATGTYLAIGDGQLHAMSGQQSFTTPGKRADGTDDWVLVLDTEPDPCGAITATGLYTPPATAPAPGVTCEVTASRQSDLAIVSRSRRSSPARPAVGDRSRRTETSYPSRAHAPLEGQRIAGTGETGRMSAIAHTDLDGQPTGAVAGAAGQHRPAGVQRRRLTSKRRSNRCSVRRSPTSSS